jgi:biotin carboxyl carrier protein
LPPPRGRPTIDFRTNHVRTETAGAVWQVWVKVGDSVEAGQTLLILESMKIEIPVDAPTAGTVAELRVLEGEAVGEGMVVVVIE